MRVLDINGYSVFINKYEVRYVEEVEPKSQNHCATGVCIVFKDDTELQFDIHCEHLGLFSQLFGSEDI